MASAVVDGEGLDRWPHIKQFLRMEPSGWIKVQFPRWYSVEPSAADEAAAYEEWADFYEWQFRQRAAELAGDRIKRYLAATRTDTMAYLNRRLAAHARGEDPGPDIPQWIRRPDLDAEGRAIVAEIAVDSEV